MLLWRRRHTSTTYVMVEVSGNLVPMRVLKNNFSVAQSATENCIVYLDKNKTTLYRQFEILLFPAGWPFLDLKLERELNWSCLWEKTFFGLRLELTRKLRCFCWENLFYKFWPSWRRISASTAFWYETVSHSVPLSN